MAFDLNFPGGEFVCDSTSVFAVGRGLGAEMKNGNQGALIRGDVFAGAWGRVPQALLLDVDLSERARLVLIYLILKPPAWVPVVGDICRGFGLDEKKQWPRVRDELRTAGLIPPDHPYRSQSKDGRVCWRFNVDFSRYYFDCAPETPSPLERRDGESRSVDKSKRHPPSKAGMVHPPIFGAPPSPPPRGDNHVLKNQFRNTTSTACGGGPIQQNTDAVLAACATAGLDDGEARRVIDAAKGAEPGQLSALADEIGLRAGKARAPVRLSVFLAKLAKANQLSISPVLKQDWPHPQERLGEILGQTYMSKSGLELSVERPDHASHIAVLTPDGKQFDTTGFLNQLDKGLLTRIPTPRFKDGVQVGGDFVPLAPAGA